LVAIFAIISIIPGMIIHPATGWLEGTIMLAALILQVLISAYNDYNKDSKFIEL
jgi:Ca2+-transporting ATPase